MKSCGKDVVWEVLEAWRSANFEPQAHDQSGSWPRAAARQRAEILKLVPSVCSSDAGCFQAAISPCADRLLDVLRCSD